MKLALRTSWLVSTVVVIWAIPQPIRRGLLTTNTLEDSDVRRAGCRGFIRGDSSCLVMRQGENEPPSPTKPANATPSSSSASTTITVLTTDAPLSPTSQSILSSTTSHLLEFNNSVQAQSGTSSNVPTSEQLRTVGIVGGFLAGIALVAIIGIIFILLRNQRRRSSSATSSLSSRVRRARFNRSRSRTYSSAHPIPPMIERVGVPIMRPALRIQTGGPILPALTMSHDLTTAGTLGHASMGLHHFPTSASSRTTSFGHNSSASTGRSGVPRRPPQIPSLGLSQPRPWLRSLGSLFSNNASIGHPHAGYDHEAQTEAPIPPGAPSTVETRTIVATEEVVRSEETGPTEETAHTAVTTQVEAERTASTEAANEAPSKSVAE